MPWMDVEFLVLLLAGFYWKIYHMSGCGISGTAAGWISPGNETHGLTWNFR